jgi:two-component system LytT family response regulator
MIRALIVEDEVKSAAMLENLLHEYCPNVKVAGKAHSVKESLRAIERESPDLVFLDISLPDGDGFEILEQAGNRDFQVIFTTAYQEYAIKAYEFAAVHYLLKPINEQELQKAVERLRHLNSRTNTGQREVLMNGLNNFYSKIALPSHEGILFVDVNEIIRCEAINSYTIFYLTDKSQVVVTKTLRKYESLLSESGFLRVHDKHLVNMRHIWRYVRGKGGNIIMFDGFSVDVSARKKEEFLARISAVIKFI